MLRINSIKLDPGYTDKDLRESILRRLRIKAEDLLSYKPVKRSIDARDKSDIKYVLCVDVSVKNEKPVLNDKRVKNTIKAEPVSYRDPVGNCTRAMNGGSAHDAPRPVIVGFGPAGMICAYKLACAGMRPIVIERGLDVDTRIARVNSFWKGGDVDKNTNVQFGEGGAGTFSDGKLSTMIHDKVGRIGEFFRILVENGADESIMYNAKPHVGTDRLAVIVRNIRNKIIELGGEVRFGYRLTDIIFDRDRNVREVTVEQVYPSPGASDNIIPASSVVLAIGHSARDTFEMLHGKGFMMEQKPFAVGVRVQHPQEMISISQYGKESFGKLPPADYKLTYTSEKLDRSVYSFCMCPGGFVVNSSSEKGRLVVNGMSNSDRSEATANSAIVVNVDRRDFADDEWNAGIRFQRRIEELAFIECSGKIPVQTYGDFSVGINASIQGSPDGNVIPSNGAYPDPAGFRWEPNTKGFWDHGNIHNILPKQLCDAIIEAFPDFGRRIAGFDSPDALLMGVESRTSSPVRIVRTESLEAAGFNGIYPCGEGAGYAGGITSAAVDGIRVYERIVQNVAINR